VLISMKRTLRCPALLLAGAATTCVPVWGAAKLTVTGVNFTGQNFATNTANGLKTQTGTTQNCRNAIGGVIANPGGVIAGVCTDTAFVVDGPAMATSTSTFGSPKTFNGTAPTTQTFSSAFSNAVSSPSIYFQPTLAGWKIVNGGTLDMDITAQFTVIPGPNGTTAGGMFLSASVTRYDPGKSKLAKGIVAPTTAQLVWTQALYINFGPGGTAKPANTLDDYTVNHNFGANTRPEFMAAATPLPTPNGGTPAGQYTDIPPNAPRTPQRTYADPIYGGQLDPNLNGQFNGVTINSAAGVSQLLDVPAGLYSVPASFRAIALISAVNTSTKTITVFDDGVNYGFDLSTPEPPLRIFSLLLFSLLFAAHRWRSKTTRMPRSDG
jgi:hypothetical protein